MKRMLKHGVVAAFAGLQALAWAGPMTRDEVPAVLKDWLPWALHGQATALCPAPYNADTDKACVWPARLVLRVGGDGVAFTLDVQVFAAPARVALPGEAGQWPQSVKANGQAVAVAEHDGQPVAELPPGRHVIEGSIPWADMPQDLRVPTGVGSVVTQVAGVQVNRAPDAQGRLWLRAAPEQAQSGESVSVRTARLIDDQVPMRVSTHYELAVAGKAREIVLPAALLPGLVAEQLDSPLPARLREDGALVIQARPGNWALDVTGRLMSPAMSLTLPKTVAQAEEVWAFLAHNDVRLVSVEGLASVDPKQVAMPDAWRAYPAFRLKPGDTMRLTQTRRGNPVPNPDSLKINRQIWLDFDGQGYTVRDDISGTLSRSSRLEMAAPGVLGRASVDDNDQPITRLSANGQQGQQGLEVRGGAARISADSRITGDARSWPATGWAVDFNQASATLKLPPGWRLLHASGVDQAEGSWLSRWTLWDFFFVLLSALAAGRLLGVRSGVLLGAALVLSWHMSGAPQALWLVLLACHALAKVLPQGKLRLVAHGGQWASAAMIALMLLPYAVDQVRLSMYPALERPWQSMGSEPGSRGGLADEQQADAAAEMAASPTVSESSDSGAYSEYSRKRVAAAPSPKQVQRLDEFDPGAKVQTGPGVPVWQWNAHQLSWQGPVQQAQTVALHLLPPWGTALLRLGSLALLALSLWSVVRTLPRGGVWRSSEASSAPVAAVVSGLMICLALAGVGSPAPAHAKQAVPAPAAVAPQPVLEPAPPVAPGLLDELRERLTAPPDCLPACADVPRLLVEATGSRIQLRLEIHTQADVAVPLPGQGAQWRPQSVMVNGQVGAVRRDEGGALWVALGKGVNQVVLEADVGSEASVDITLPMPVREVRSQLQGWSLSGLDARGLASGALSLARTQSSSTNPEQGTQRDALPPFVRVERTLRLGLNWTMETRVTRVAPSLAPIRVRVRLMAGESVNDDGVQVDAGHATLLLGSEASRTFVSSLREAPRLSWISTKEPHQIEVWRLDASTQWHVSHAGLAPVQHQEGGRHLPTWQPWPGEQVDVLVSKPAGVPGQTLTVDRVSTTIRPGVRATDVSAVVSLRSSQGGNHRFELPQQAELLAVAVDGQVLPVQQQAGAVVVPITPGAHTVKLDWREARGMGGWFQTASLKVGAAGVNDTISIDLPLDRVVLAVGGPSVGPAVLFWGVLAVVLAVAVILGRLQWTPLRAWSWALLGLGIVQMSFVGMLTVVGWLLALEARGRLPMPQRPRWFGAVQVLLALWGLMAAGVLLETVRVGLLGYPDMMILGNGSDASHLHWYADRFSQSTAQAWVVSAPVYAYRIAMLLWALWLAASLLRWVRWAWACFSAGGYWRAANAAPVPSPQAAKAPDEPWVDEDAPPN